MGTMIFIMLLSFIFFASFGYILSRYRTCPADKILVVYGETGNGKACRCIHGGGVFVFPIIQDYQYLDLTPLQLTVIIKDVLCLENIMLNVSSKFTFAISTEPDIMEKAAERLLGQSQQAIQDMANDIITGQIRLVIAQLCFEDIRENAAKITSLIGENVNKELNKIGLHLINVNISRIVDENSKILI